MRAKVESGPSQIVDLESKLLSGNYADRVAPKW
jgi:hypothetical protein